MFSSFISVGTYNIRNTTDRYDERRDMLLSIFQESLFPDICGVQEVRFQESHGFVDQAVEMRPNSSYSITKTILQQPFLVSNDHTFRIDGNCIYSNDEKFHLLSQNNLTLSEVRNAQRVALKCKNSNIIISFTNVHLHHLLNPPDAFVRLDQIQRTLSWMKELDASQNTHLSILVGDFNCSPDEIGYGEIMQAGYQSAFLEAHGSEPFLTFPTGLQATTMDTDGPITCDYIFLRNCDSTKCTYEIQECTLFGNQPHAADPTLYPSDHIGVRARVKIENLSPLE